MSDVLKLDTRLPWRDTEPFEPQPIPEIIYAVKDGRETGIFYDWNECKASVTGYPNANYKSFSSDKLDEAYEFLYGRSKRKPAITKKTAVAYIRGSHNQYTKQYGSGVVLLFSNEKNEYSKAGKNSELARMKSVGGELAAVSIAVKEAVRLGATRIILCYDNVGVAEWANGNWNATKTSTIAYKEFIERMGKKIKIMFSKSMAHSGENYDVRATELAKEAVGIT